MGKKLTYEEVKVELEKHGYELLEAEYINRRTKMRYRCPKHPDKELSITLEILSKGCGCPYCGRETTSSKNRKLIINEVRNEFIARGYVPLFSDYRNVDEKLKCKCSKHPDIEFCVSMFWLKRGQGCPKCKKEKRSSNINSDIKNEFMQYGLIPLFDKYTGCKDKLKCKCSIHQNHELFLSITELRCGTKPPCCEKEMLLKELNTRYDNRGYVLIDGSNYKNNSTKLKCQCKKHLGKDLYVSVSQLKNLCPLCKNEKKPERNRISLEQLKQEFINAGYTPLFTDYNNSKEKLPYRCPKHPDKKTSMLIFDLRRGNRCPWCSGLGRPEVEEVKMQFISRGYVPLFDHYENANTKLPYRCPKHPDKELSIKPNHLKQGKGCLYCAIEQKQSKGCDIIEKFLKNNNILYNKEKTFPDCKHKCVLRFDFAIYFKNTLQYLIEFDGKQHYEASSKWGGEKGLKTTQLRDRIKNEYCLKNNIPLYRIRYDQINEIESILEEILQNHCVNF